MNTRLRRAELASFAHNLYTQAGFSTSAESFLEKIKEAFTRRAFQDAKPMRKSVRTAVKDLSRLQMDYREIHAVDLMPYYEAITDTLANLACQMWEYIEQSEEEGDTRA